jgi:hypothetical protein
VEGPIVISFHAAGGPGRGLLARARALEVRARAHGAALVGWDASRVSFAFSPDKLAEGLALAMTPGDDVEGDELPWGVGVAQGDLERFAPDGSHGQLAWGAALVAASLLSAVALPGEILCAQTVRALQEGALLTAGARFGRDGTLRVRGARLDRVCPWRSQAVALLSNMRVPRLVGSPVVSGAVEASSLLVVRADPGAGGTRTMIELASRAPRSLLVSPSGSGFEPLGALRRALARSVTRELSPLLLELADPLESLLAGEGVTLDVAARLVSAFLWPKTEGQGPGLLLLDDAKSVDPATLEACVRAAEASGAAFGLVARLDATGGVPSVLGALSRTAEIEVSPLSPDAAEELAGGCLNDALDATARRRWARLGAHVPLAVVESVAYGIVTGDLTWKGEVATPRSRASGRGKVRAAAEWLLLRARDERPACQTVLGLVALLGGEAKVSRLARVLERVDGPAVDVEAVLEELMRGRWLVDTQEDWVAFPSRTHREALAGLCEEGARAALHSAVADTIEDSEGAFGRVEAAWHAAQAGDGARGARVSLAAARATAAARLEASTTQLIAFARRADPSCEEEALELLANALERAPSVAPKSVRSHGPARGSAHPVPSLSAFPSLAPATAAIGGLVIPAAPALPRMIGADDLAPFEVDTTHDSEPPTLAKLDLAPMAPLHALLASETGAATSESEEEPLPESTGASIATRLGELAREALLHADNAALERWVDGLRAAGESPMFTERLGALSRLGRGDIGDALRVLRRTRSALDPKDHKQRCQTSLALGVALSVAGRPQEALLEGMDALARARHGEDAHGAAACLAFLAKLYASVGRAEATELRVKTGA